MKKIWISSTLCLLMLLMAGCSSSKTPVNQTTPQVSSTQNSTTTASKGDLTLAELKKYNGQSGNPAYVAVDGIIYDVTNAKGWKNGQHKDGITAGLDLSKDINAAPHGKDVLTGLTVIGKIK
jgi:predicted heme/steroid binding protein